MSSTWKHVSNWKGCLISLFLEVLNPYDGYFLATSWKRKKKQFEKKPLSMHLRTCFGCHHRILKNNDFFLRRLREISLIWFSLVSVLTERCKHTTSHKAKRNQSLNTSHAISKCSRKFTFYFNETVNGRKLRNVNLCHIVTCICHFYQKLRIKILEYFHGKVLSSIPSNKAVRFQISEISQEISLKSYVLF